MEKRDPLEAILATGMMAAFLALVGVVMLSVTTRFFLPFIVFSWTEETSRFLFIWVVALGAPCALKRGEFVSVDFLIRRFPRKVARGLQAAFSLVTGGFFLTVFWYSLQFARLGLLQMSPTMRIPMVFAYASMVVVSFFLALYAFRQGVLVFRKRSDAR
jgi:TRAP-type C4-dicarboxylate transport system permease small subunit